MFDVRDNRIMRDNARFEIAVELKNQQLIRMSFPHDSRPAALSKARTTSQPAAAADQDMSVRSIRRQVPRILVVDDNPAIAALMSQLLSMRGYEVVTAADAHEAEAEVRRLAPDLVLSDVRMPGKSGYELCREFKSDPATRLIPFVLITGLVDSADRKSVV